MSATPGTPRWIPALLIAAFALLAYVLYAGYDMKSKPRCAADGIVASRLQASHAHDAD